MNGRSGRITVLGGRGMLGSDVAPAASGCGYSVEVLDRPEFDITDEQRLEAVVADAAAGGLVVNCAAYTDVERAESEKDIAFGVNARAVGVLGRLCRQYDVPVVHISTDFVFDGALGRPYAETDEPNALSVYGKSKLEGERLLAASGCRYCIIRLEWTYGVAGNNFVKKIIDAARLGRAMRVVDDQVGSPTATFEAGRAICELIGRAELPVGIYHYGASGYVSRYETARFIIERLGLKVDLSPCKTAEYKTAAARPLNSRFDCRKIQGILSEPIKQWDGALAVFLEQL